MRKETFGSQMLPFEEEGRSLFDEEFGMSTTLSGTADIGGQPKRKQTSQVDLMLRRKPFGCQSPSSLSGDIEWDRKMTTVVFSRPFQYQGLGMTSW